MCVSVWYFSFLRVFFWYPDVSGKKGLSADGTSLEFKMCRVVFSWRSLLYKFSTAFDGSIWMRSKCFKSTFYWSEKSVYISKHKMEKVYRHDWATSFDIRRFYECFHQRDINSHNWVPLREALGDLLIKLWNKTPFITSFHMKRPQKLSPEVVLNLD